MALGIYAGVAVTTLSGVVIVAGGAVVDVKREDTNTAATLFSDRAGTTPLASLVADVKGRFQFYAAPLPQGYKITVTYTPGAALLFEPVPGDTSSPRAVGDPITYTLRNQQVQLDATAYGMTLLDDADAPSARTTLDVLGDVLTAKGDLIAGGSGGTNLRKAVGADGSVLVADSAQAEGIAWSATALPALATQADANAIAYAIALG